MRQALAAVIFFLALITLMMATCMFKEMPIEKRRKYREIKD